MKKLRKTIAIVLALVLVLCMRPTALADSSDVTAEPIMIFSGGIRYTAEQLTVDINDTENGYYWNATDKTLTINEKFNRTIAVMGDLELLVDGNVTIKDTVTINDGLIATTGDLRISPAVEGEEAALYLELNEAGISSAIQVGERSETEAGTSESRCVIHSGVTVTAIANNSQRGTDEDKEAYNDGTLNVVDVGNGGLYLYGHLNVGGTAYLNITGIKTSNVYVMGNTVTEIAGGLGMEIALNDSAAKEIKSVKTAIGINGNIEAGSGSSVDIEVLNYYSDTVAEGITSEPQVNTVGVNGTISIPGNSIFAMDVIADNGTITEFVNLNKGKNAVVSINEKSYLNSQYQFKVELDDKLDIILADTQKEGWAIGGEAITATLKLKDGVDATKYALPEAIEFYVADRDMTRVITYDSETGEITCPVEAVYGPITIKAAAKELPAATPENPTDGNDNNTNGSDNTNNTGTTSPDTSDSGHPMMWVILLAAGVAICGSRRLVKIR